MSPVLIVDCADHRYSALVSGDDLFGYKIQYSAKGSNTFALDVDDVQEALQRLSKLQQAGIVASVRPEHDDYRPLWIPDTVSPQAEPLFEVGDTFPLMGITEEVRRRGRYGADRIALIVDTGVDAKHVAFDGKTVLGDIGDSHGHGTHVASTAASAWGIASDATIYSAQALPGGQGTETTVAQAIDRATRFAQSQRARAVMNLSLGGSTSRLIQDAVRAAIAAGITVCAAAGNSGGRNPIGTPADVANLIVMSVNRNREFSSFTDGRGWRNPNRTSAFGEDILAAAANTRDGKLKASGTSMATPHIAGVCLLVS